jgi:hypothetical protein
MINNVKTYKVKNVSGEQFSFEGLTLAPGTTSPELTPEVYQRLLALYMNSVLRPVDPSTMGIPAGNAAGHVGVTTKLPANNAVPVVRPTGPANAIHGVDANGNPTIVDAQGNVVPYAGPLANPQTFINADGSEVPVIVPEGNVVPVKKPTE